MMQSLCVIAVAAVFTGCPGNQFRLGVWVFYISNVLEVPAVEFNANGTGTEPSPLPPQANSAFTGVVTWQRNGSTVTMDHVIDGGLSYQYVGELSSPVEMAGTFQQTAGGNGMGTFTAYWVAN